MSGFADGRIRAGPAVPGARARFLHSRTQLMKPQSIRSLGIAAALFVGAGLAAGPVSAQQGSVAGQVTDKSNQQPVAGAGVLVVGTSLQAGTGRGGRHGITNVPPGRLPVRCRFSRNWTR